MRDPLCSESYLLKIIESDKEEICENKKEIIELKMIWKRAYKDIQKTIKA